MIVKLEEKEIEVKKMPIGRYAEFLSVIKNIFSKSGIVKEITTLTNDQFLALLPEFILKNLPEVLKIIQIATGMPEEEVKNLGLNECIDLLMAIFTVNKYTEVYEKIKKGLVRLPKSTKMIPETGLKTQ